MDLGVEYRVAESWKEIRRSNPSRRFRRGEMIYWDLRVPFLVGKFLVEIAYAESVEDPHGEIQCAEGSSYDVA